MLDACCFVFVNSQNKMLKIVNYKYRVGYKAFFR